MTTELPKHLTDAQVDYNLLKDFAHEIGVNAKPFIKSKTNYTYILLPTIHPNFYLEYGVSKYGDNFIRVFYQDENMIYHMNTKHKAFKLFMELVFDKSTNQVKEQRYTPLKVKFFNEILDNFKTALSKYDFNRKLTNKLSAKGTGTTKKNKI